LGEDVECIVEHRKITVINGVNIDGNTDINLTVYGVGNPEATSAAGTYTVYQYNADGLGLAAGTPTGTTITALPSNIYIKSV